MAQNRQIQRSLPPEIEKFLVQLGERIRIARKRRDLTMEDLSSRMFVTRQTLARLEKGDLGVSLAVFASALWALGLEKDLLEVAVPERDQVGIFHERKRLPQRVRKSDAGPDLDF